MHIEAHIVVKDAAAAAEWYRQAFGAEEIERVPLPHGKVLAVTIKIGDSVVHLGSEFPTFGILSPLSIGGTATVLQINTDDAEKLWIRATSVGAVIKHSLADAFWGERHGQLSDPFGHRWNIAQKLRQVSPQEIAAIAATLFGS